MAKRILIVEDDKSILRGLEMNLQLEGYETLTATDGQEALRIAREETVDLIVLDIMLPKVNGYQVVQMLRQRGNDVVVILLSAKAAELDKVMGLDVGADDYVTKPFSVTELLARIKAHLRRRAPASLVRFDDVVVDLEKRVVTKAGEEVVMTTKEFDVLVFLLDREGRPVTRDAILQHVWGSHYFGTDRTVDNFITRLRQKIDRETPVHIRTVRGVGYRFVLDGDA